MSIDMQIDTLSRLLVTVLGGFILVVSAVLIYIIWLCVELDREMRRRPNRDKDTSERGV